MYTANLLIIVLILFCIALFITFLIHANTKYEYELTNKDRVKILKRVLEYLNDYSEANGICVLIVWAYIDITGHSIFINSVEEEFDLILIKPKTKYENGIYWWDVKDKEIRKKKILELINHFS